MKTRDLVIGLIGGFCLWVAYLILSKKFNPQQALQQAWKDLQNLWNQIVKSVQDFFKQISIDLGFVPSTTTNKIEDGKTGSGLLIGNVTETVYKQ